MPALAWWWLATAAVVCSDQASKAILCRRVGVNRSVRVAGGVRLHHVASAESLFGVRSAPGIALLLWGAAVSSGLLVIALARPIGGSAAAVGVAVALGGATGNLIDRLVRGHIVDFIEIGLWPTFNLADAAITVGIGLTVAALGL
jgi:signal peptidase II